MSRKVHPDRMSDMHRVRPGIITFPEYLDILIIADIAQKHNSFRLPPPSIPFRYRSETESDTMRIRRGRRKKLNIGIIEIMCIIVSVLLLTLLIAYIVTSRMDRKIEEEKQKEEVVEEIRNTENQHLFSSEIYSPGHFANNQETVDYQELIAEENSYVQDLLKDFHVSSSDFLVTDKKFTLSGRWFQTIINDEPCYNTVTQGAMVYFQIRGTNSFDIKFVDRAHQETPNFAYIIDDGEPIIQSVSENSVELPDTEEHNVTLVMDGMSEGEEKWSEEIGFAFSDIDCHDGEMNGYIPKQKRILFVGDSIVEGCMTLGNEAVSAHNSATHSAPWYTARALYAEPYFLGYGGTGIATQGTFCTTSDSLDYLSEKRYISSEDYPSCDLIVLNTGTNDYAVKDTEFTKGYEELLNKLHEHYPDVAVICVVPFTQTHAKQIRQVAGKYEWAYLVETAGFYFDTYDKIHPSDEGARKVAGLLVDFITKNGVF